jgi:uncharacterized protein YukE
MNEEQLLELKKEIDEAKTEISELKGTRKQLMKDLQENWDCKTLEEAEKKHKKLGEEITALSDKINIGVTELNEKYAL